MSLAMCETWRGLTRMMRKQIQDELEDGREHKRELESTRRELERLERDVRDMQRELVELSRLRMRDQVELCMMRAWHNQPTRRRAGSL